MRCQRLEPSLPEAPRRRGKAVQPAVISYLNYVIASGIPAREPDARGNGFSAGLQEANHFGARYDFTDYLSNLRFKHGRISEYRSAFELTGYGFVDLRIRVSQGDRTQPVSEIDKLTSLYVPYAAALPRTIAAGSYGGYDGAFEQVDEPTESASGRCQDILYG